MGNIKAMELTRLAVDLYPKLAKAHAYLAWICKDQLENGWSDSREEAAQQWLQSASRAVKLDPNLAIARLALALCYRFDNKLDAYTSEMQRVIDLAEGEGVLMVHVGAELAWANDAKRGLELVLRGIRLDPEMVGRHADAAARRLLSCPSVLSLPPEQASF